METILPLPPIWFEAYERFGHEYWTAMMNACGANVCKMAHASGVNRTDMYKRLKRFDVRLPKWGRHYGGHRGNWGNL